jgi:hypothetical protein
MHLGMLKHLMERLQSFLKNHKRFDRFNNLCLSVPSYLTMTAAHVAYGEVSRWTGKELKRMSTFLLAVLRAALHSPTPAQRGVFNRAILCTRALLEFFFYASYTSHDQATLDLMENALRRFHEHRDVFRQYRAGKRAIIDARDLRTELIQRRDAALAGRRLDGLSPAVLRVERHSWNAFIDAEVVNCAEDGAHWNFAKLHLMLHFCDQVRRLGSFGQWSTEIGESSHRRQIKDGYNAGNRTGDVYIQIINYYLCLDAFTVRAMNHQACRAKHDPQRVIPASSGLTLPPTAAAASTPTADVASTTAADAASASIFGPPTRLHCVSPQLTTGPGKVTTLGGVFGNMWTPEFREAIHNAMRGYLHSQRVHLPDQQLLECRATIHHGIDVSTDDMHGSPVVQRVRCTISQRRAAAALRNQWISRLADGAP